MRAGLIAIACVSLFGAFCIWCSSEMEKTYVKEAPKWRALGKACMDRTPLQTYKDCRAYCGDMTSSFTPYHYCLQGVMQ